MKPETNRREFLGTAAQAAAFTIVPRHVLGGQGYVAPSDKITLAHIGMGTQSFNELGTLLSDPQIQIVAVCDPNEDSNDYIEWSKGSILKRIRDYLGDPNWRPNETGCPGGREVGRFVIETYYAKQRGKEQFRAVRSYADFRELLEKEKDVDAVKIMTPDHLHAIISIAAMRKGKHVMVHKPISNRLYEARLAIETARKTGLATHLLAYGSGAENGRIAARIKEGVIGTLREIHNWSSRPFWPQYTEIPKDTPPVPKGFNWDLWLGPCTYRPYHPHYTHTVFRGWYDFGGGSFADMGIYSLWPVFVELNLDTPVMAEAWGTHACTIENGVSRTIRNDFSYPHACTMRFRFAPRPETPSLELWWYDGGMKPRMPEELEAEGRPLPAEGILFIGDKGKIIAGFNGQNARLIRDGKITPLFEPEGGAARQGQQPGGRRGIDAWIRAVKGGPQSPGSFLYAGPISDTVCLGTVALRAGQRILFDSTSMRVTNVADANKYLFREYRPGWELKET